VNLPEEAALQFRKELRDRAVVLAERRRSCAKQNGDATESLKSTLAFLSIAGEVTNALETLNQQLFQHLLNVVQSKMTIALQEVLEQPISFRAEVDFKRGASAVEFSIERGGKKEDVYNGQGGSVANVLSVGLRMLALTTLEGHRRVLILDEQDCWLRPDLVPRLVKIVHDAGKALGFQIIMISHHDIAAFESHADKIYRFTPLAGGAVQVSPISESIEADSND
jgi:ABC-type glutathione transport system ATPase component